LVASDPIKSGFFGRSVAISGDTAIIGAYGVGSGGPPTKRGAAYVFVRDGGVWTEQQKLVDQDGLANDNFGYTVAIDGDTAVVGAYQDDHGLTDDNRGSAFVFTRSEGVWTERQMLVPANPEDQARVGSSVALAPDAALLGAFTHDSGALADAGAVLSYDWAAFIFADGFESGDTSAWE
jgi:hypothetical protein